MTGPHNRPVPPDAWRPAVTIARRVINPVERFLAIETASGIVLVAVSVLALLWANSPLRASYEALWHIPIGVSFGRFAFERDLHFWINDGLMTIFFFLIGLEIRREIHNGELQSLRRAALPLCAALGGMLVPALIYIGFNQGRSTLQGWGVPMATDIAFAVGVLTLLGRRMPPATRVLLLGLAVIDDVGAILVIALVYSSAFSLAGLGVALLGIAWMYAQRMLAVRSPWSYVAPTIMLWAGVYAAGVHPTLAGVITGLLTPVRAWYGKEGLREQLESATRVLDSDPPRADRALPRILQRLGRARAETLSPVDRLEHDLHGPVAFGIMPLFALANAGVSLGGASFAGDALWVFVGITLGLCVGKPLGVLGLSALAQRLRLASLPASAGVGHLAVVGTVAGIGFTMALFIAQLAFPEGPQLETAKLAVLTGSALAAAISLLIGLRVGRTAPPTETAVSAAAES